MAKCDEECSSCGMTLNHYCMACDTGGHPAGRLYELYRSLRARVKELLGWEE